MSARSKNKKWLSLKFIVAMMLIAWVAVSFILRLPPASWIPIPASHGPETMEEEALLTPFPEKAPFRFGSRALSGVCDEYSIDAETIVQELEAFAIKARPEWSIKRIAKENDMETDALFEVIREVSLDR